MSKLQKNTDTILKDLEQRFFDIPFENSDFQNEVFVIAAQQTPARAYRAIGLRMFSKIQAIKELKFSRELEEIEIDEQQAILDSPDSTSFEKRKANIEINKRLSLRGYTDKLLNDALHELNFLYSKLKAFPEYSRESFEAEERQHFEHKLAMVIETKGNGALESLAHLANADNFTQLVGKTRTALEKK